MVTFTIQIEEQRPGMLTLDFVPSDKAQGSELEVQAGEIVCRAIDNAFTAVMNAGEKSQSFAGGAFQRIEV
jgi:hypothetical protein